MRQPPKLATTLLDRMGPIDPVLLGDLEEAYRGGRSKAWYWRQTLAVIALALVRQIKTPTRVAPSIVMGWAVLGLVFAFGDAAAYRIASGLSAGWTHAGAYQTGVWWPFHLAAILVSYAGFALSGWIVGRAQRRNPRPILLLYITSVELALLAAATTIAILAARGPVPVPHPLFYVVSVTLPYQWRSGFLFVPTVMLAAGLLGVGNSRIRTAHRVLR